MTSTQNLRHVRQAPASTKRGTDSAGQVRRLRGAALDDDPRGRTLCGAEPTTDDLANRQGRSKTGRKWVTCDRCLAAVDTP